MAIKRIVIEQNEKKVVNLSFFPEEYELDMESSCNCFSLLLGENGVGKSRFLKMLQDIFLHIEGVMTGSTVYPIGYNFGIIYSIGKDTYTIVKKGAMIIARKNNKSIETKEIDFPTALLAVSFMVNDKFYFKKEEQGIYRYLGVRSIANGTHTTSVFRKFSKSLVYALRDGKSRTVQEILEGLGFDKDYIVFSYYLKEAPKERPRTHSNLKYNFETNSFLKAYLFTEILRPKAQITSIKLKKKGHEVEFSDLSSGEMHMLFAMVNILYHIKDNSVILIDEPEISLHPEWQISYINRLKNYFEEYHNCHFIIASHSHYLVSDMPIDNSSVVIFKRNEENYSAINAVLYPYTTNAWSAENIIYNVFGMRTTRNYYFEQDLADLIEAIEDKSNINTKLAQDLVNKLKQYRLSDKDPLNKLISKAEELIDVQE